MKRLFKNIMLRDYLAITVGSIMMALGISVFLIDARVVPGGVSGLAMSLHYLSGEKIPVGMLVWVFNIPLYIWGVRELGKQFGARTFYGFTISALFIDIFHGDIPGMNWLALNTTDTIIHLREHDFLFLILLGAVFLGLGLGIIFKFKGSTGGSDIIAAILQKRYGVKPGQAIMLTDFIVISFAGIIIYLKDLSQGQPPMSLTLYAFFLLFVSARLIDIVLDGFDYARSVIIISDKHELISEAIMNTLSRGATALKGRGIYKNIDREVIMTIVPRRELTLLTEIIEEIDPDAFVTIHNVHEVLGQGFRRRF
ncbi:MAG: YitT family protein [Calditrichaceae bacterium]|nr:YitT family protein [Calditrichaceae bacterium]MBN2707914.1 YitT family protein [Calditrichaceae bacterium]RQV92322.1 MAG: YitT family protein [Calditrichota bacterium]